MFQLLLVFSLITLGTSCGKKSSNDSPKPETRIDPIHVRPLEITQKETLTFLRKEQMVNRYDCKGILTSRKLETQNGLSKKITINYSNRKDAWEYSVYNRRTKSSNRGAFTIDGKFVVDYAPTVFNMRVKEGINDVEYVFNKCTLIGTNPKGERVCLGSIELEKEGMVQIDVYYSSEVISGEQNIHPTAESCQTPR